MYEVRMSETPKNDFEVDLEDGYLIKELSNNKKKIELDKILNSEYGISLIKKFNLDSYL